MGRAMVTGPLELDVAPFDLEATFDVRRGSFRLPLALKKKPEEWARAFAQATPDGAIVTSTRDGADEVFRWRVVRVDIHAA